MLEAFGARSRRRGLLDVHSDRRPQPQRVHARRPQEVADSLVGGARTAVEHIDMRARGRTPVRGRARRGAGRVPRRGPERAARAEALAAALIGGRAGPARVHVRRARHAAEHARARRFFARAGRALPRADGGGRAGARLRPAGLHPTRGRRARRRASTAGRLQRRAGHRGRRAGKGGRGQGARGRRRPAGRARDRRDCSPRGLAQVSTNVHDPRVPLREVVEAVRERAGSPGPRSSGWRRRRRSRASRRRAVARLRPAARARERVAARERLRTARWRRQRRKRKHRGTRPGRRARPRAPAAAVAAGRKQIARQRRQQRLDSRPPGAALDHPRGDRGGRSSACSWSLLLGAPVAQALVPRRRQSCSTSRSGYYDRPGASTTPPARAAESRPAGARLTAWTCACSPSGRCRRTASSSAATAPIGR